MFDATNESTIHRAVVLKLGPILPNITQTFKEMSEANANEEILRQALQKHSTELKDEEMQYLLLVMYRSSNDSSTMSYNSILKMLQESKETLNAEIEEKANPKNKAHDKNEYEEDAFEVDDNTNKIAKNKEGNEELHDEEEDTEKHRKMAHSAPPGDIEDNIESMDANEKLMIEIAQKAFTEISEKLLLQSMSIRQFFNDYIEERDIKNERMEVISVKAFTDGLKRMGIEDLSTKDIDCLIHVLSIDEENADFLKIDDLEQIINEYNNASANEKPVMKENASLPAEGMDEISLVVMYALNQQLINEQSSLRKLLGENIFKQPVKVGNEKEKNIEAIKSEDFYVALDQVGIKIDPKELSNLKELLCIAPEYPDIFMVRKIERLLSEFSNNEELRQAAQKCYENIAKQEDVEEAKENEIQESPDKQDELVELNEGEDDKKVYKSIESG